MVTIKQLVGIALGLAVAAAVATPSFAQRPPTGARAKALRECSIAEDKYIQHVWGDFAIDVYRACMAQRGQRE